MKGELGKETQDSHQGSMQFPYHINLRTLLELWTAVESTKPYGETNAKILSQACNEEHHYEIEISAYSEIHT